jgi:hypothetical protein
LIPLFILPLFIPQLLGLPYPPLPPLLLLPPLLPDGPVLWLLLLP